MSRVALFSLFPMLFGGALYATSIAGYNLTTLHIEQTDGKIYLTVEANNPVNTHREGLLMGLNCPTQAGEEKTYTLGASSPEGSDNLEHIAAHTPISNRIITTNGFSAHSTVTLQFMWPEAEPLDLANCKKPYTRGAW